MSFPASTGFPFPSWGCGRVPPFPRGPKLMTGPVLPSEVHALLRSTLPLGAGGPSTSCPPSDTPSETCVEGPPPPLLPARIVLPVQLRGRPPDLLPRAQLPLAAWVSSSSPSAAGCHGFPSWEPFSSLRIEPSSSARPFLGSSAAVPAPSETPWHGVRSVHLVFAHLTLLKSQSDPDSFLLPSVSSRAKQVPGAECDHGVTADAEMQCFP